MTTDEINDRIELLEWWINPQSRAPFSEASKDMMRWEIHRLKRSPNFKKRGDV